MLFKNVDLADSGIQVHNRGTGPRSLHFNKPLHDVQAPQGLGTLVWVSLLVDKVLQ